MNTVYSVTIESRKEGALGVFNLRTVTISEPAGRTRDDLVVDAISCNRADGYESRTVIDIRACQK